MDIAGNFFLRASKCAIKYMLGQLQTGHIRIEDLTAVDESGATGETLRFGTTGKEELEALLVVRSQSFWARVFLKHDIGFAEAYMAGEIECSNLVTLFRILIQNDTSLTASTFFYPISFLQPIAKAFRRINHPLNASANAAAHYDMSNEMFSAFLSSDLTYSCPIWAPVEGSPVPGNHFLSSINKENYEKQDLSPLAAETLESAQHRKLLRHIVKARIKASDHVLEIGTGWGSFAILAVQLTGCRITSITLSKEQKQLAEHRIEKAGLQDKITVLLRDYRQIKIADGEEKYDKIVSIEMLEAVGEEFLDTYFECVDSLLKQGGIAVFQCITMPEERHAIYRKTNNDFMAQYIFPGGYLPSNTQLFNSIVNGSAGRLTVESVENIGGHYCRTLRLWREAFLANFDELIKPAMVAKYECPCETDAEAEKRASVFKKKWEYYFAYCEAAFREKILNDVIIRVARAGCMELYEGLPL